MIRALIASVSHAAVLSDKNLNKEQAKNDVGNDMLSYCCALQS